MQELTNVQFLSLLRNRNIDVSANGGRLRVNAPAGTLDESLRVELARRKADLLRLLETSPAPSRPPLPAMLVSGSRPGKIPQTQAQQGLWLIDQLDSRKSAYNIPAAFMVEGSIDLGALQLAVDQLVSRHETLRTSFYEEDGELFQAIAPAAWVPVEFTDLSILPESDRDQALSTLIREQAAMPFDLARCPLVRFHLFRLATQRNAIFFNIHHIIADHKSLVILCEELEVLYQAAMRNEPANLPALPIQFADYAIWTARQLADRTFDKQLQYWKNKLAGLPEYLDLRGGRAYPEERAAWAATTPVVIGASLRDALSNVARQEGATLFMALLAVFAVLLYRQSGQEDFCIGSPITYRRHVETQSLIGFFVNMLAFRCQFAGEPSFRELLKRVRATALGAYDNSDLPFQELVRVLNPNPSSPRSPFFQVMFGFDSDMSAKPGRLLHIDTIPATARFDLTLQLSENPDGISGWFEYAADLFDAKAIAQLATGFVSLLGAISTDPDQPISHLKTAAIESATQAAPTQRRKGIVRRLTGRLRFS